MIRIIKSKKGMTVTEVILALAILGIVSVPLMAIFSNSILLTQMSKRQMQINSVMQIVKGEVTKSVKSKDIEVTVFGLTNKIKLSPIGSDPLYDAENNETVFLKIEGGNLQDSYKYKVQYLDKDASKLAPNIVQLNIKLYTSKGKFVSKRMVEISYK